MEKKLVIPVGEYKIVAEVVNGEDEIPSELCIYIEDKDNCIIQDIATVRQSYHYDNTSRQFENEENVDCLVWADTFNEDYTHKFTIGIYQGDEE